MSEGADVVRVDAILRGVGANPSNGALHVVKLRGPAVLGGVKETVVYREGHVSGTREELHPTVVRESEVEIRNS